MANFSLPGKEISNQVYFVKNLVYPVILGMDIIQQCGMVVNYKTMRFWWSDKPDQMHDFKDNAGSGIQFQNSPMLCNVEIDEIDLKKALSVAQVSAEERVQLETIWL